MMNLSMTDNLSINENNMDTATVPVLSKAALRLDSSKNSMNCLMGVCDSKKRFNIDGPPNII